MKGEKVKEILKEKGLQQKKVAEKMGISEQNLQSLLKADDIKSGVLENISKASGVSLFEFYGHDVNIQHGTNTYNTTANTAEFLQELKEQRESYKDQLREKDEQIKLLINKIK